MIILNGEHYTSLQKAIDDAVPGDILYISNGIYEEVITIKTPSLILQGEDRDKTIIRYHNYANKFITPDEKCGTFRSYTCLIDANKVELHNLTIENTAGLGEDVGQTIALYADGDIFVSHCNIRSHQDTLFLGPLPKKSFQINGFRGPKELSKRTITNQHYSHCLIEGDIDFIFGGANAIFEHCIIHSLNLYQRCNGYVCAPCTYPNQPGLLFDSCSFTSNCKENTVYLGRPWRDQARCVIKNSFLDKHITKEGWHDWGKDITHVHFEEINNHGPGSSTKNRVPWLKRKS